VRVLPGSARDPAAFTEITRDGAQQVPQLSLVGTAPPEPPPSRRPAVLTTIVPAGVPRDRDAVRWCRL